MPINRFYILPLFANKGLLKSRSVKDYKGKLNFMQKLWLCKTSIDNVLK